MPCPCKLRQNRNQQSSHGQNRPRPQIRTYTPPQVQPVQSDQSSPDNNIQTVQPGQNIQVLQPTQNGYAYNRPAIRR